MKRIVALILMLALMAGVCLSAGGEAVDKYDHLTVGLTTAFSGNFLSDALGSNISDQDVRKLIHSYNLVEWDSGEGLYRMNPQVVSSAYDVGGGKGYTFTIDRELTYNDGTPITAKDYAFSFLLLTSQQLMEATGNRQDGSHILGWQDYDKGASRAVAGFRVMGDYQIKIQIAPEFQPYFFEMKTLDIFPLPIEEILPGCEVKDDGEGIYLSGSFSAELLKKSLLDPENGYATHPKVTSGPYTLESFNGTTAEFSLNQNYKGDSEGEMPTIPRIIVTYVNPENLIASLAAEDIDLAPRCVRTEQILAGSALSTGGNFSRAAYSRNGLSFISFCGEHRPTSSENVRKAIAMCLDKDTLVSDYTGQMGTPVNGFYGIGQWMFLVTRGTIIPAEEGIAEEEWSTLTLDGVTEYKLDVEAAKELFDRGGWKFDEAGGAWTEGVRHDKTGAALHLKLIYPEGNQAGPMLEDVFAPYLAEAGAELELVCLPMPELLEYYYGLKERDCDMILLGTNMSDVFDPSGDYNADGYNRLNGITDPELQQMTIDMRQTEPGDSFGYVQKWIKYIERKAALCTEIPLYSNAYMDFFTAALQNYAPGNYSSWAEAVQHAVLTDYVEEEEAEDVFDEEEEEGEDDIFLD